MRRITITFGDIAYTGLPLTLDAIEELSSLPPEKFGHAVLKAWLEDSETQPPITDAGAVRMFPREIAAAINTILDMSGLKPGEATAGAA